MTRSLLLFLIGLTFVAVRLPTLLLPVSAAEISHAGAARHLVLQRDRRPSGLVDDAPLASLAASPAAWALSAPDPEWDPAGPGNQMGWLTLFETRAPDDSLVPPPVMALLSRLPFLLLGVLSLVVLERFATRFYGPTAGTLATVIVAGSAGLATTACRSVPAALAMPAMALVMAAFDDHARALQYNGAPPTWLFRTRTLACGAAVGVALSASFAFVPIVAFAVIFLVLNRRVVRGRGDRLHVGAFGRAVKGGLTAVLFLLLVYGVDFGSPLVAGATHPALAAWSERIGGGSAAAAKTVAETVGGWSVPLPTWLRGLAHAGLDALRPSAAERLQFVSGADGPLLAALALAGLAAWPMLARDRTDTPTLLGVLGYGALGTALLLAPRHATVAALAAIPPLAVLVAAWLTRLGRRFRTGAVVVGAGLLTALAGSWLLVAQSGDLESLTIPGPAHLTAEDEWVTARFIAAHEPKRVVTILGREEKLRISGSTRVAEIAPGDPGIEATVAAIRAGESVVIIRGGWMPLPATLRQADDLATAPLGPRLVVTRQTPSDD